MASDAIRDVDDARDFIAVFCEHNLPGTEWGRIYLGNMNDADALFVAGEFALLEAEVASGRRRRVQRTTTPVRLNSRPSC